MTMMPETISPRAQDVAAGVWRHPFPGATRLDAFRRYVNRAYRVSLQSYQDVHKWSVENLEDFAKAVWVFCGVVYSHPPDKVANGINNVWPRPEWFPGARINFAENIFAVGLNTHPDSVAVSACREAGTHWRHLTWRQLHSQVALYTAALRAAGVGRGDRVAGVLSNSVEAVVVLLASGAVGAIFSSMAPDMGAAGIVSRYAQIQPKIIFVDTEVLYAGKRRILHEKLTTALAHLRKRVPELGKVVVITGSLLPDPGWSGTTGVPKCICHSGGGALLQQKKELILTNDMNSESTYYQYTTTGWMMWNYLIGSLSVGSRIVLYDGSPLYPNAAFQIHLLEEQGVTHWGTSPKLLNALKQSGFKRTEALQNLRLVVSSGSPLSAETSRWFRDTMPSYVGLFSGSGGTDLVGGILSGNFLSTIHDGELASPQLGMDVQVWDYQGCNVDEAGDKGDLVITTPFFSMPVCFWGDRDSEKYRKAYFDRFPGVWCHGDFVQRNPTTSGYAILGRSDGVLNPGGIRFGTAEIYAVVDHFSQVQDCIAVGQRRPGESDEQVLLFLKTSASDFNQVRGQIQEAIREQLSPRHVPAHILHVNDIPCTSNGKVIEMVVKAIVCKSRVANIDSVANPECLAEYRKFVDLPSSSGEAKL
ncbi:hypothetical protein B0J15DRAFT_572192 [Fusarium solani]|uniref:Acetoacetyl-CoA synthetase n=1 Tax=Fusarium solani TaxID=169388 RepID=A0A9P9G7P6_FUSSL|nr:uncharacterized protein B0J15DRAFT_572192 [Fusarium solani]KAH7232702.1 hypothetical protein B0J15DRAFT_572192 [Fusarium solani]